MTAYEALQKVYDLDASLTAAREQLEEAKLQLPQLKALQREANAAAVEYSGSMKKWFRKLSGKEDQQYSLEQTARKAQAALDTALREVAALETNIAALEEEQAALGEKATLLAALSEEDKAHFHRLEASLHAEQALLFLNKCKKELEQAQYYARNPMLQMESQRQEDIHKAKAGALADKCRETLEVIFSLGFGFPIHPYLQNPMGYIVTARRYGDQDQMNKAQDGIRDTEKMLKELLLQLAA